jgi:histidinol-phosphatase (PHP family)
MIEYVKAAIKKGIDVFGFSEHAPLLMFDPKYRMRYEDMKLYEAHVKELKEQFSKDITIRLGYECDYLPRYEDPRIELQKVDYFIGSVHFIDEWGFDNPEFIKEYKNHDIDTIWQKYFDLIHAMAKSGKYDIVGHLDLIKVFKFLPKNDIRSIAHDALVAIKRANMTIEINGAGWRKPIDEAYPSQKLLSLAYEMDIPITFASDAHAIEHVGIYKEQSIKLARDIGYTQCADYEARDRKLVKI